MDIAAMLAEGPPPRARGRPLRDRRRRYGGGSTPASAGTTGLTRWATSPNRVHPRERGDDVRGYTFVASHKGPPPRARGRPVTAPVPGCRCCGPPPRARGRPTARVGDVTSVGSTPASAGTTWPPTSPSTSSRVHPRERGDDSDVGEQRDRRPGPPPRARGRHLMNCDDTRVSPAAASTFARFSDRGSDVSCSRCSSHVSARATPPPEPRDRSGAA